MLLRGDVVSWPWYLIEWLAFWSSGTRRAQSGHSVSSGLSTGSVDPRQFFHAVSLVFFFFTAGMEECNKEKEREKRSCKRVKTDRRVESKGWSLVPSVV